MSERVVTASLPSRPSIENLRNQAKSLLKSAAGGANESIARFRSFGLDPAEPDNLKLSRAQFVIARELEFPSWSRLKTYVESLQGPRHMRPFHSDIGYYADRAEGLRSQHQSGLPASADQIRANHPLFAQLTDAQILAREFTPEDALLVTAREHGFDTWLRFKSHIGGLAANRNTEPFMQAFAAIEKQDGVRLAELLGMDGSLALACGTNNNSLLNLAVSCKFIEGVQLLLEAGADVNQPNVRGLTPLHQAAYSNLAALADTLMDAGANTDAYAHGDGGTPLILALFWGHREVTGRLARRSLAPCNLRVAAGTGNMDLMRSLFSSDGKLTPAAVAHRQFYRPHSGFPVWAPSDSPQEVLNEAFVWAAKSGRLEALEYLLDHGAQIDADPYRGTALTWAAAGGDLATLSWLLDHGADVNCQATFGGPTHGEGVTALHLAAQNGRADVCKLLVSRGANPGIKDALYGGNACGHASHFGHEELAAYFEGLV